MSRAVMQRALEALEAVNNESLWWGKKDAAIAALRAALTEPEQPHTLTCVCGAGWDIHADGREELAAAPTPQPEQEPVAWRWRERINSDFDSWVVTSCEPPPYAVEKQPLYTAPPQRKPLTHPQIHELDWPDGVSFEDILLFVRAIEAAHGITGEKK